jgi:ABC-2 type transport system permease protein
MIPLLFKYRLKMSLSIFRGGKGFGKAVLFLFVFILLAFGISSFAIGVYQFARMNPETGETFLRNLTAMAFHGMFLLLLFWGLSLAVFTIFFSSDLDLLLTLPIKSGRIFVYKIIEANLLNTRVSFLFLVPILIIMGIFYGAQILYYIIIMPVIFLMASIPASLGIIIATLVTRRISRARLKGAITVVGSLIGVGFWAAINKIGGRLDSENVGFGSQTISSLSLLSSPLFKWLPSGWAYNAAVSAARGETQGSLVSLLVMAAVSSALFYAAMKLTASYYAGGIIEEVASPSHLSAAKFGVGNSPLLGHVKRDIILLSREPGVVVQSMVMVLFLLLAPFVAGGRNMPVVTNVPLSPLSALLASFFGSQVGSRLMPLERLGFWRNLAIPGGRRLALLSKLGVGFLFTTALVTLVSAVHYAAGQYAGLGPILIVLGFAWTGLAIGVPIGLFWGKFNWDNPRNMLSGGGGFIYALLTMGISVVLYALLFLSGRFIGSIANPIIITLVFSLGMLTLSVVISSIRLDNMEWNPEV